MAKIVLLDSAFVNPGDFSWENLYALGECAIYDRTLPHQILERCSNAKILIVNKILITRDLMNKLPKLKYIGVTATGVNNIDLKATQEKGILVTNVPAYSTASVAQHTLALLLETVNHVGLHDRLTREGAWGHKGGFCFWEKPLTELENLTLGIIGFGSIGRFVAKIAQAFGMTILVNTRSQEKILDPQIQAVDQKLLFQKSDIVSLHCPLTKETRHLIREETLHFMKPHAILINTARGGLVDEYALAKALREKRILAAAVDVLEQEPPTSDCPLLNLENCIITPHIAWASCKSRHRLLTTAVENVKGYLSGYPQNIVLEKA